MSAPTHRRPLVGANWKMNLLAADAAAFCRRLVPALAGRAAEVVVFPSFPLLPAVATGLAGSPAAWGGQDLHPADAGAHTGDVSGAQLADAGCTWVLCGHSERRHDHGEGDALIAAKVAAAARHGLAPIACPVCDSFPRSSRRDVGALLESIAAAHPTLRDSVRQALYGS